MMVRMQHATTRELRDVETNSPEMRILEREVTQSGQSAWERVRDSEDRAVPREEATYAELLDKEVCGDEQSHEDLLVHQALVLDARGVPIESNPHVALTGGELDAGLTPELKLEQIRAQYAPDLPTRDDILNMSRIKPQSGRRVVKAADAEGKDAEGKDAEGKEPEVGSHAQAVIAAASGGAK